MPSINNHLHVAQGTSFASTFKASSPQAVAAQFERFTNMNPTARAAAIKFAENNGRTALAAELRKLDALVSGK